MDSPALKMGCCGLGSAIVLSAGTSPPDATSYKDKVGQRLEK